MCRPFLLHMAPFQYKGPEICSNRGLRKRGRHELLMDTKWCRCFDELQELLSNVGFQRDRDVLVLAGDFCNKGPQSAAVVRFAREIGALAVVGNHELLSLRARDTMLREGEGCPLSESKYAWTRDLSDADLEYLRSLPFTIRIPMRNALIVHGGLIPGGTLGKQNLLSLITTRTLVRVDKKAARTAGGRWLASTDTARGVPWATQWRGPEHVYFGHTTRRDVMVTPFATGLDTGCVYGGKLSAAVLEAACAEGGAAGRCGACGQELVMTRCSNRYKCKIGACSNKHPCKRSDARCPNVACASSGKPVAAKHKLVAVKARQMYDANLPWKPVGRELAEVKRAAAASARHGASASTLNRLQNKAESVQVGAGAGGGGSVVAPQMDAARRGKRGGKGGSIARVPEDMELRVGAMLAETGPLVQARFLDVWAARYPEAAFDYSAWGFVRLGSALKAMPGAVMLARPEGSLTDTVFPAAYQTLLPYDSANLVSAQGHAAAHKHVRDRRSVSDAAASSVSDVVRHGLAAAVAHEAGAGPDEVAAFLAQPALRFTLDCLVSQFVKYRALQDANGSNCPPSPPPPP